MNAQRATSFYFPLFIMIQSLNYITFIGCVNMTRVALQGSLFRSVCKACKLVQSKIFCFKKAGLFLQHQASI